MKNPFEGMFAKAKEEVKQLTPSQIKTLIMATIVGVGSLVNSMDTKAQGISVSEKHYTVENFKNSVIESRDLLQKLKPETDTVELDNKTIVYTVKNSLGKGNVIEMTETRKDGTKLGLIDGRESENIDGSLKVYPANGMPGVQLFTKENGKVDIFVTGASGNIEYKITDGKIDEIEEKDFEHSLAVSITDKREYEILKEMGKGKEWKSADLIRFNTQESIAFWEELTSLYKSNLEKILADQRSGN